MKKRVGILISGRGSNMKALVEAARDPGYPAEIVVVISNRPDAPGLAWAKEQGIPVLGLDHKRYESREHFEGQLDAVLRMSNVEIVALAGFMRIMTAGFVERWRDRMINIHPSLLPSFKGLHTHERAIETAARSQAAPSISSGPKWTRGRSLAKQPFPSSTAIHPKPWHRVFLPQSTSCTPFAWLGLREIKSQSPETGHGPLRAWGRKRLTSFRP